MKVSTPPAEIVANLNSSARRITTTSRAARLVWRVWGNGPPLLLAHGAQGSWTHWVRNIETLAATHTVIAVDLPGHGDSGMPACNNHRTFVMALQIGLLQILGKGQCVDLIGFSFGAVILAYLAAAHPDLARSLVLVGAPGLGTPSGDVPRTSVRALTGAERQAALKANLLGLMLHDPAAVDDLALYLLETNGGKARLSSQARSDLVMPDKLSQILPMIRMRLQAIWGEHDRPLPRPDLQEQALRSTHPDVAFHTVAEAGHWAMYERPGPFNTLLLNLLAVPGMPNLSQPKARA